MTDQQPKERLSSPLALVVMLVVVSALLAILQPGKQAFEGPKHETNPDALSISYLKVLIRSDPDNESLRIALVKQLLAAGLTAQADNALAPLLKSSGHHLAVQILELRINLGAGKAIAVEAIDHLLQRQELALEDMELSIGSALAGGNPLVAAKFAENIARKTKQPEDWQRSIDYYVASGEVSHAANLSARLLRHNEQPQSSQATAAMRLYLAADKLLQAKQIADTYRQVLAKTLEGASLAYQVAQMSEDYQAQEYWNLKLLEMNPDDPELISNSINTALASQKFEAAIKLVKRQLGLKPESTDLLRRLAQLYEWNSQPLEALDIWYQLALKQGDSQSKIRTLALANATYNYQMIVELLRRKALLAISPGELDMLATNAERIGEPDLATDYLHRYTQELPEQRHAWQRLLKIHHRNEAPEEEMLSWEKYRQHHTLNLDETLRYAALLWQQDKADKGFQLLMALPAEQYKKSAAYWRLRSDLAWYLQRDNEAIDGYNQLLTLTREKEEQLWASQRLLQIAVSLRKDSLALLYAELIWRHNDDVNMLLAAMSYAIKLEDTDKFRQLMEENPGLEPRLNGRIEYYWSLLASYYQQMNRSDLSILVWNKILARNPSNTNAKISLLWVLMERKYDHLLKQYLHNWQLEAVDKKSMWHVMATAYSYLGDCKSALSWYRPLIQNRTVRSIWLLDYARNLDCAGYITQAQKIASYYLQQYQNEPLSPDNTATDDHNRALQVGLSLLAESISDADKLRWLSRYYPQLLNDPTWQLTDALAGNDQEKAQYLYQRGERAGAEFPLWQQLAMAISINDQTDMRRLIEIPQLRSDLGKIAAYQSLGEKDDAMLKALSMITDTSTPAERLAATRLAAGLRQDITRGAAVSWQELGLGEFAWRGVRTQFAHSFNNYLLDVELDQGSFTSSDNDYLFADGGNDLRIRARFCSVSGGLDGCIKGFYRDWNDDSVPGLGASISDNYLRNHRWTLEATWQGETRLTPTLLATASDSQVSASWQTAWTSRASSNLELAVHDFQSLGGDPISKATSLSASGTYHIRKGSPLIDGRVIFQQWQFDAEDKTPEDIIPLLEPAFVANNNSVSLLVPDDFTRLELGLRIQHDEPGIIGHYKASPHYFLDISLVQQIPNYQVDFNASAGLGWRIMGDDELYLSLNVGKQTIADGEIIDSDKFNASVSIGYNIYWGR